MKITFKRGPNTDIILASIPDIDMHLAFGRKQARKFIRGSGIRLPRYKSDRVVEGELTVTKPK